MAFEQIPFALGYVDFRPGIPAWVAREAGQDFTRTFRLVGRDLRTTYPAGPYCLISTAVEPGTFTA